MLLTDHRMKLELWCMVFIYELVPVVFFSILLQKCHDSGHKLELGTMKEWQMANFPSVYLTNILVHLITMARSYIFTSPGMC